MSLTQSLLAHLLPDFEAELLEDDIRRLIGSSREFLRISIN